MKALNFSFKTQEVPGECLYGLQCGERDQRVSPEECDEEDLEEEDL